MCSVQGGSILFLVVCNIFIQFLDSFQPSKCTTLTFHSVFNSNQSISEEHVRIFFIGNRFGVQIIGSTSYSQNGDNPEQKKTIKLESKPHLQCEKNQQELIVVPSGHC